MRDRKKRFQLQQLERVMEARLWQAEHGVAMSLSKAARLRQDSETAAEHVEQADRAWNSYLTSGQLDPAYLDALAAELLQVEAALAEAVFRQSQADAQLARAEQAQAVCDAHQTMVRDASDRQERLCRKTADARLQQGVEQAWTISRTRAG